jgi:hypothetical protein
MYVRCFFFFVLLLLSVLFIASSGISLSDLLLSLEPSVGEVHIKSLGYAKSSFVKETEMPASQCLVTNCVPTMVRGRWLGRTVVKMAGA